MKDFKTFAQENKVRIPLIQRDYVQGSDANADKRNKFLNALLSALKTGTPLSLDFIYGSENSAYFEPLDGQQRITTLFLLYHVLKSKSSIQPNEELDKQIEQFTYTTRNSSTAFCQKLFAADEKHTKSEEIKDQSWFCTEWLFDPTIKAMLDMMDSIDTQLQIDEYKNEWDTMAQNLYGNEQSCILFEYLNIGEYNLDDSLYVKMNARGKQLTDFENWKAEFIKYLEVNWKDKPYKGVPIRTYFEQHIEHEWTDMLWGYAVEECKENYPQTDALFMNLYDYLLRMTFFVNHPQIDGRDVKIEDFNTYQAKAIDMQKEELYFLFGALDFFSAISKSDFWSNLFYLDGDEYSTKVRLFGPTSTDLFSLCVHKDNSFTVNQQVLLYCILRYGIKHSVSSVNDELVKYVRVCRNLIESIVQRDGVNIRSNVRLTDMAKYDAVITQLIASKDVHESLAKMENTTGFGSVDLEKDKATWEVDVSAIEDFSFIRGNLQAFDKQQLVEDTTKVYEALQFFEDARTQKNTTIEKKIIGLLILQGFHGINCGWCKHGKRYFFGTYSKWDTMFFAQDKDFTSALKRYIQVYRKEIDMNKPIEYTPLSDKEVLESADPHISILTSYMQTYPLSYHPTNYLSIANDNPNSYDYIVLGTYSSNPLMAYHFDIFSNAVYGELRERLPEDTVSEFVSKVPCQYADNNSGLLVSKAWFLVCRKDGWRIQRHADTTLELPIDLIERYHIEPQIDNTEYWMLPDMEGKNRVETAVAFICDYLGVLTKQN